MIMSIKPPLIHKPDDWKYTNLSRYNFDDFCEAEPLPKDTQLKSIHSFLLDPNALQSWLFYNGQLLQKPIQNECLYTEGGHLVIPKQSTIKEPIYIVHITESDTMPLKVGPKNLIIAEEGSKTTLIEMYLTFGEKASFTHSVTEVRLEDGATLTHLFLQRSLSQNLQIAHIEVTQSSHTHYRGTSMMIGGETNRATFQIHLNGSEARCQFYALTAAYKQQCMDVHLTVQHNKPNSKSTITTRGIVKDKARGAFTGKIVVQKGAHKTEASLESKNLLLSSLAEADTRPQLEIYNHDIQCSHGATVGHLDLDALFYLRSRGIPESEAIQLLIDAFIMPSLEGIPPFLQSTITRLIHEH